MANLSIKYVNPLKKYRIPSILASSSIKGLSKSKDDEGGNNSKSQMLNQNLVENINMPSALEINMTIGILSRRRPPNGTHDKGFLESSSNRELAQPRNANILEGKKKNFYIKDKEVQNEGSTESSSKLTNKIVKRPTRSSYSKKVDQSNLNAKYEIIS